jgi:hypothetical protein
MAVERAKCEEGRHFRVLRPALEIECMASRRVRQRERRPRIRANHAKLRSQTSARIRQQAKCRRRIESCRELKYTQSIRS